MDSGMYSSVKVRIRVFHEPRSSPYHKPEEPLELTPQATSIAKMKKKDKGKFFLPSNRSISDDHRQTLEGHLISTLTCSKYETVATIKNRLMTDVLQQIPLKFLSVLYFDLELLDDTKLEELIGRNVRLDYVDLSVQSTNPARYPLQIKEIQSSESSESYSGKEKESSVEILVQKQYKPFLGGYRQPKTGLEFHNATTQTVRRRKQDYNITEDVVVSRQVQTNPFLNEAQQTLSDRSTQTAISGIHLSKCGEKEMESSGKYFSAADQLEIRVKAVAKIQNLFRRFLARKRAREEMYEDLSDDEEDDLSLEEIDSSIKPILSEAKPQSKEDFQRLYAELESWRLKQEKKITDSVRPGFQLRQSRAKLVSMEGIKLAELAANRDRHKLAAKQEVVKNVIMKAGQPKMWLSTSGKMLQLETPGTRRAKELYDIYVLLANDDDVEGEDRLPALHAVAETIGELDQCPLADELLSLVIREEDLINRGVRASNLENLRKRIVTKYLQLVRSPDHNPEIIRYEKQLPVPVLYSSKPAGSRKGGSEFCLGCRKHLPRKMFSLSTVSSIGRCINCEQLDNDARSRQDLSVYKSMMDRIKRGEESRDNTTSPIFQLQDSDIRHVVRSFWDSRSILSGQTDLYELRLVRYYKDEEWSPWNCILLTHQEAEIHAQLGNLYKSYGHLLVQKIRHKHTLARNHFSKLSTMAKYFSDANGNNQDAQSVTIQGTSLTLFNNKV